MPCPLPKLACFGGSAPSSVEPARSEAPTVSASRGSLLRQLVQVAVDDAGALAAFVDRPHDQRLAAAGVAGGEHALGRGRVRARLGVAALILLDAELLEHERLRRQEAHREQDEVGRLGRLGALDRVERRLARVLHPVDLLDAPVRAGQLGRRDREVLLAAFLDGVGAAQLHRPARPRREVVLAVGGRLAEQLDLRHRRRALAVRVADAVRAGVAAADHDHVLAGRGDRRRALAVAGDPAVAAVEVLHRVVDAVELAPRDGQVARHARAGGDDDGVVALAQLVGADIDADIDAVLELHALGARSWSRRRSTTHFSILKSGTPKRTKPAARLVALVDRHRVAGPAQLLRGGEAGRAGADHRDAAAGLERRRPRHDPALVERAVDDRDLDLLDRHRVALADLQHAGGLARRRAQLAGELREVVGGVQLVDRRAPAVAVDQVVPVRDQVAERAAVVAERNAAFHTARALLLELRDRQRVHELAVVLLALERIALGVVDPLDAEEGADLAHQWFLPCARSCMDGMQADAWRGRREGARAEPLPRPRTKPGAGCARPGARGCAGGTTYAATSWRPASDSASASSASARL